MSATPRPPVRPGGAITRSEVWWRVGIRALGLAAFGGAGVGLLHGASFGPEGAAFAAPFGFIFGVVLGLFAGPVIGLLGALLLVPRRSAPIALAFALSVSVAATMLFLRAVEFGDQAAPLSLVGATFGSPWLVAWYLRDAELSQPAGEA